MPDRLRTLFISMNIQLSLSNLRFPYAVAPLTTVSTNGGNE